MEIVESITSLMFDFILILTILGIPYRKKNTIESDETTTKLSAVLIQKKVGGISNDISKISIQPSLMTAFATNNYFSCTRFAHERTSSPNHTEICS
jgi:hypothetical protein